MLFIYLAVLITALYYVLKILGPEMRKASLPKAVSNSVSNSKADVSENRMERLESLLAEKSKNIGLLQKELKIFQVQVREFDKVKILLEDEIQRLREQNRIFRSELGLPAVQSKETSIT